MSIFIMEPVLSTSSQVSEKDLWQAEALLQNLADRISELPESDRKAITKQKTKLFNILKQDKVKQRNQSDWKIKQALKTIGDLNNQQQKLNEEMDAEIDLLTGNEDQKTTSIGKVLDWKQKEDSRLDGIYFDSEHRLAQYASELDSYTVQLNHIQAELQISSTELSDLIKENEKLSTADRSKNIQTEINELSVRIVAVLKKSAGICKVPFRKSLIVDDLIAVLEKELKEISTGLIKAGEPLKNSELLSQSKHSKKQVAKRKSTELEVIIDQVKALVDQKKDNLKQLYSLRKEYVKLSKLENTARQNLSGELARIEKQKSRISIINEAKTKQEYRRQNLNLVRDKITEVESHIDTIRKKQYKIRKRKQFNDQRIENIRTLKSGIDNCFLMLNAEKADYGSITSSTNIWQNSIRFRIKKVRKCVNFGSPLRLLFLPFQCYNRYKIGLIVRKDLVKAERSLQQLGLLDEDYIKQVDIFNRKNKKGQQLCLDILYC